MKLISVITMLTVLSFAGCGTTASTKNDILIPTGPGSNIIRVEGNTDRISWNPDGAFVWDAPVGDRALCAFPLPDGSRFEDYGLCTLDVRITGGPVNVMIFLERPGEKRMVYRPIDIFEPPEGWRTIHLDLRQAEIVREGHFKPESPCIAFHLWSMDTGYPSQEPSRRIEIRNVRLKKRYLDVDWNGYEYTVVPDSGGDLVFRYNITIRNRDSKSHRIVPAIERIGGSYGSAVMTPTKVTLAPGDSTVFTAELRLPAHHLRVLPTLYCEWFLPVFTLGDVSGAEESILRSSDRISLPLISMPETDGSAILFDRDGLRMMLDRFKNTDWGRREGDSIIARAEQILKGSLSIPDGPGWAIAYYYCHEHRCTLQYQGPGKHYCPVGGEYRDVDFEGVDLERDYRAGQHSGVAANVETLAMAYVLTGDTRFSAAALDIIRQYREKYFTWDWLDLDVSTQTIDKGRLHFAKYMETYAFRNFIDALVLLRLTGGVSDEEARKDIDGLFLPALTEITDYRMGILCRQSTITVTALIGGLAFNNAPLTAFAVHSPYGYYSLRKWGFTADGISHGHGYAQSGHAQNQAEIAQMLYRLGIDTFDHEIKRLIDGSFWWSVPMNPSRMGPAFAIAARHYPDPVYRAYASRSLMDGEAPGLKGEKLTMPFSESVNYPNSGLTILRRPFDDGPLEAEFKWSMPDNRGSFSVLSLGLNCYGYRCQSYPGHFHWGSTDLHHKWQIQTASHSTIVIDSRNQSGMKDYFKDFYMPHPSKQIFFEDGKDAAVTVAYNDRIYPGVKIWRAVAVVDGAFLVMDCLRSAEAHTYDHWFHGVPDHSNGQGGFSLELKQRSGPLGEEDGYGMVNTLSSAVTDGNFGSDWNVSAEGSRRQFTLSMRALNDAPVEVIHGFEWSYQYRTPEKEFMLLRREKARNADFVVLFEPHRGKSTVTRFERFTVAGEKGGTAESVVGIRLTVRGSSYEIVFNPAGESVTTVKGTSGRAFSIDRL